MQHSDITTTTKSHKSGKFVFSGDFLEPNSLPVVPNLLAPGTGFMEDNFSTDQGLRGWFQGNSSTLHLLCLLYFHYYYMSSNSDHQVLDPRDWGPLLRDMGVRFHVNTEGRHWLTHKSRDSPSSKPLPTPPPSFTVTMHILRSTIKPLLKSSGSSLL